MSFRPIFGKPRLLREWGDEIHERETHWTSLFYDLLIVAALNAIAEPFEELELEDAGGYESGGGNSTTPSLGPIRGLWLNALLQFASVITPWNSLNEYTAIFEDESFIGHLAFFVHCFGLASTTAGCVGPLEKNWPTLATGIILSQVGLIILYARPMVYIPLARAHSILRTGSFLMVILLMGWGLTFGDGPDAFEKFRILLIGTCIFSWLSWIGIVLLGDQRLPLHIQSYADRQKEVTMVIFGEAIFAVTLQPRSNATSHSHFYLSLSTTLWLIYSLALQEYHIVPSVEDHALRRSIFFGFSWSYTQFLKQIFLMGAAIGIKRVHLLTFVAPDEPIDQDTRDLVVWGISLTLFSVVLIRSWSLGYGRHPSKYDPPPMYWLKVGWWTAVGLGCLMPQLIGNTVMKKFPEPLACLSLLGGMMLLIILFEACVSNLAAQMVSKLLMQNGEVADELTYLRSTSDGSVNDARSFLHAHCPKTNQEAGSPESQPLYT